MISQPPLLRHPANVSVRKPHRGWGSSWAAAGAELPKLSIHLPICNELPQGVRETLDALAALEYDRFEVLVIDHNTTDPHLWEPVAEHCARLGPKFRFFTLGKYKGFKAGALNFALRETAPDADIIGVIDSGCIVQPDWLRAMVLVFADPKVGFAQSPLGCRDTDGSLFKRLMFERNAIIRHGTMTLIRTQALLDVQGWAEWCVTEDAELGLRLFRAGYEAVYTEKSFGKAVLPDDFAALRKQRSREAYGAMRILRAHAGALFNPFNKELTRGQRRHFVTGWLPWMGDALGLLFLVMGLAWSVGLILDPVRFEFPIAPFMLLAIGLSVFKIVQLFALTAHRAPCGFRDRVGAAVAGLALSHSIGKAVWWGLFTNRLPFLRRPNMTDAPVLVRGLAMAREEFWILLVSWGALLGVAIGHYGATLETRLWCAVLFTQSLPYLAAVGVSILAMPRRLPKRAPARARARLPGMHPAGSD
jgi:cellulose synthase/poly-beta-1,6-N-acetylglucosamine synthase-like glycosyltransferase